MVGAHDRRVDHLHASRRAAALVEGFQHQLPDPGERPAPELLVDGVPLAEMLVQIAPRRAGPGDPEHPVEHQPVVLRRAPALAARRDHERREKPPFLVCHQAANQDRLPKNSLESRFEPCVNPLCQQLLVNSSSFQTVFRTDRLRVVCWPAQRT